RQQAIAGLRRAFGYGVQPQTSPGPDSESAQDA
ncbi:TPA: HIT family protein, partial [Pseudomonas aeruginosa]